MIAKIIIITAEQTGQRIDNFLIAKLKGLPKSRIYRALRNGEVRVNKGRVKPLYRLQAADQIRIPPLNYETKQTSIKPSDRLVQELEQRIVIEDNELIIINKPSGLPVHGGTRVSAGLIEMLRMMRPTCRYLELVHRLDRETSGCLLIAKKRQCLVELHQLLTNRQVQKQYILLVKGRWQGGVRKVDAPLLKNCLKSGERIVRVDKNAGKPATTLFQPIRRFRGSTLLAAKPISGRTHQIRVHAALIGHPIAGDTKYGDKEFNQTMQKMGLTRLFLHAASIYCELPKRRRKIALSMPLPSGLKNIVLKQEG